MSEASPSSSAGTRGARCRLCGHALAHVLVDLGMSPISNAYLSGGELSRMEPFYPLRPLVCDRCWLVQLEEFETPEQIFGNDYAYFSSYSASWLAHAERYTELAIERFGLDERSRVVELASNDGYLLQFFVQQQIPVLGVEPAANVAAAAEERGVPTAVDFFGAAAAETLAGDGLADLLIANNVLAHVPDLNDFLAGMKALLAPDGAITVEFPHLLRLLDENQFDTIYHEHFSYFSFLTACRAFERHGLRVFDVEELETHGGSLRVFACHDEGSAHERTGRVEDLIRREREEKLDQLEPYLSFAERARKAKREILGFFVEQRSAGARIAGYGAPAKGNTMLNFCGIRSDFLEFTVDRNPHKQGRFLPGSHIPIRAPEAIAEARPDFVYILAWNLKDEIMEQISYVRDWGGRFVTHTPSLQVHE
ncbi:MAG: class I SAM-dependent methyltransferase [Gaiellaceae bacterium]